MYGEMERQPTRSNRRIWAGRAICVAALAWTAAVLFAHWMLASLTCAWDTSYCAHTREKNGIYQGVLVDSNDQPIAGTPFTVAFASRRDGRDVGGFSSDGDARYCIVWARERITPFVHFASGRETSIRGPWRPLHGPNPPPGCQSGDRGIPWDRADDLKSAPQFLLVAVLGFATMGLLLLGLALGRVRAATRVRGLGVAMTIVATAAAVIVRL
jgi:hypothetical protein